MTIPFWRKVSQPPHSPLFAGLFSLRFFGERRRRSLYGGAGLDVFQGVLLAIRKRGTFLADFKPEFTAHGAPYFQAKNAAFLNQVPSDIRPLAMRHGQSLGWRPRSSSSAAALRTYSSGRGFEVIQPRQRSRLDGFEPRFGRHFGLNHLHGPSRVLFHEHGFKPTGSLSHV